MAEDVIADRFRAIDGVSIVSVGGSNTAVITPPIISAQGATQAEVQYKNVTATPANSAAMRAAAAPSGSARACARMSLSGSSPKRSCSRAGTKPKLRMTSTGSCRKVTKKWITIRSVIATITDVGTLKKGSVPRRASGPVIP